MTIQAPERLLYQGEEVFTNSTPLDAYFAMAGLKPGFSADCSALSRGYIGGWEIVDDRLYLVRLQATFNDDSEATLGTVFPDFPARVFAHWYTGEIRIPQGEEIPYPISGTIRERELILEIERGVVAGHRVEQNEAFLSARSRGHASAGAKTPPPLDDGGDNEAPEEEHFRLAEQDPESQRAPDSEEISLPLREHDEIEALMREFIRLAAKNPVPQFAVESEHLRERLAVEEIERREMVIDPRKAVPALPFGHLHKAWRRFLENAPANGELWSFSANWTTRMRRREVREGYAVVQDGKPGACLLTSWKGFRKVDYEAFATRY